jgi:hypothetical protein
MLRSDKLADADKIRLTQGVAAGRRIPAATHRHGLFGSQLGLALPNASQAERNMGEQPGAFC